MWRCTQGQGPWYVSVSHFASFWTCLICPRLALVRALNWWDYQTALKRIIISLIHEPKIYKTHLDVMWGIQILPDCIESLTKIVLKTKEGRRFASSKVSFVCWCSVFSGLWVTFRENKKFPVIEGWQCARHCTYFTQEVRQKLFQFLLNSRSGASSTPWADFSH